jgi:hypothetical protein
MLSDGLSQHRGDVAVLDDGNIAVSCADRGGIVNYLQYWGPPRDIVLNIDDRGPQPGGSWHETPRFHHGSRRWGGGLAAR